MATKTMNPKGVIHMTGKLNLISYAWKCVFGAEVVYALCLLGGFVGWRNTEAMELHRRLFETLPGFTWISFGSFLWGGVLIAVLAWIFGSYMVWMHNSSMEK